ncbi:ubiquitin carboxyl-terminal hydrolase 19 [Phtheirospermum japonicum]|uniref:Ubiquitin carboxyl-terminal hydrolase 19 n=1 Tax=Phtheirospermum japonicum TaxID=374723 RepID=A0A830B989_9LAMI|nr:ubiquitin carboxyl-terminal hydrolase 19 [Phtheirospermum japonicum]
MHVAADLNWFLQFIVLAFAGVFGLLYLIRNTASRYFVVDSNFDSSAADYSSLISRRRESMAENGGRAAESFDSCAVCDLPANKQCAGCKMVKYCSEACQKSHWDSGHKKKCMDLKSSYNANLTRRTSAFRGRKGSVLSVGGSSKSLKQSNQILFPYEEFVRFFCWDKPSFPPCGLLNCGNSCFANVVLQCLTYTRPLVAYLLEKGHRIECQRDDWCFLCEFQTHVEIARRSITPFSPVNILSKLPNIGGNLGYGKQEDAHEFMRFAIDTMQSVCLDEFGGEKAVHPSYQETTLIQHIFGGRLQSQVICAECNNVSNQFENMMDLTVEIHGDAESLEECLDQFTHKEWLHGDNMYKCDGCNAYVMAWKRLTIQRAPNILTIALKRFQSGRFGKLNKRVTFPEILDLRPFMTESEDGNDVYKLYAVIVHVDMLNASYFGHYICYIRDFCGRWYRIDDCKVACVGLDEVLSQGAYMLLYSRICPRPSCLLPDELLKKEENANAKINDSSVDSGQSLSTKNTIAQLDADISESLSSIADNVNGSKNDFNVNLSRKMTEEPSVAIAKPEARDEVRSQIFTSMCGNIGQSNGLTSAEENRSSVQKSKPLIAPGFLEKNYPKKIIKPDAKISEELIKPMREEFVKPAELNKPTTGSSVFVRPEKKFINPVNKVFEEPIKPKPGIERGFLDKKPKKKFIKPDENGNVHENGNVSTESYICKSLENGESSV